MYKLLMVSMLLILGLDAKSLDIKNRCKGDISSFSSSQKEIIMKSYQFGQRYGLGKTLAAIAWQESCAGEYLVNFQDPSAGVFHAYIPNLLRKYKNLRDNGFTVNMVGQKLINDFEFSAQEAINELLYWKKVHKGNWANMIRSYNKGFSWEKSQTAAKKAQNYYNSVSSKAKKVERYLRGVDINSIYIAKDNTPKIPIYSSTKKASKGAGLKEQNELAEFIMIEY